MSRNPQTIRDIVDSFGRGDWEEARRHFDTSGKWPPAESGAEESSYLDYEGIRNYLQSWTANFNDFRIEIKELVDAGEQAFVVVQVSGEGRQTGEEVSSPLHSLVIRFQDEKILGLTMFISRAAALQAAGLSEQDASASNPLL